MKGLSFGATLFCCYQYIIKSREMRLAGEAYLRGRNAPCASPPPAPKIIALKCSPEDKSRASKTKQKGVTAQMTPYTILYIPYQANSTFTPSGLFSNFTR